MRAFLFVLFLSLAFAYGDDGIAIDPHGGRFTAQGDEGSGLDPHGGRVTGQGDGGPIMDPNG